MRLSFLYKSLVKVIVTQMDRILAMHLAKEKVVGIMMIVIITEHTM